MHIHDVSFVVGPLRAALIFSLEKIRAVLGVVDLLVVPLHMYIHVGCQGCQT